MSHMSDATEQVSPDDHYVDCRELIATELEHLRSAWERQGDPLYIWEAIQICPIPGNVNPNAAPVQEMLPSWCMANIVHVAFEFWKLINAGLPCPNPPVPGRHQPKNDNTLTPLDCLEKVPAILGLSRPGWNAFERLQRERERAAFPQGLRHSGVTASAAQEAIANARQIEELTTVAKRIRSGRGNYVAVGCYISCRLGGGAIEAQSIGTSTFR
jgi:hypothetical protein